MKNGWEENEKINIEILYDGALYEKNQIKQTNHNNERNEKRKRQWKI